MEEVPMSGMDLDGIHAQTGGPLRGFDEILTHPIHTRTIQRRGRIVPLVVRHRRGRLRLPSARLIRRNLRTTLPWQTTRGLTAGMRQLNRYLDG